jgi:hypothetical protein
MTKLCRTPCCCSATTEWATPFCRIAMAATQQQELGRRGFQAGVPGQRDNAPATNPFGTRLAQHSRGIDRSLSSNTLRREMASLGRSCTDEWTSFLARYKSRYKAPTARSQSRRPSRCSKQSYQRQGRTIHMKWDARPSRTFPTLNSHAVACACHVSHSPPATTAPGGSNPSGPFRPDGLKPQCAVVAGGK